MTKDQSLAWQLIEAGAMTADEAKAFEHANIILQALGVQENVEVVLSQVQLRKGDVALLCSDGLHGPVTDEEILSVLVTEPDLQKAGDALIQKALDRDGPDNITVALARFDGEALKPPAPEDNITFVGYDPGNDRSPSRWGRWTTRASGARRWRSGCRPACSTRRTTFRPRPTPPRRGVFASGAKRCRPRTGASPRCWLCS